MTYEEWVEKYKPIQNHLRAGASFEGTLFETYGDELDFVRGQHYSKIWTYVDDGEFASITEGYRLVNRMGYFVTEKPHRGDMLEINLDD